MDELGTHRVKERLMKRYGVKPRDKLSKTQNIVNLRKQTI